MKPLFRYTKRPTWYLVRWLTGKRLAMTTHYHDLSIIRGDFLAPTTKIKQLLPSDELQVMEKQSGMTAVSLFGNHVHQVDYFAPYQEFGVMVPVQYRNHTGFYITHLPVSSNEARWTGVEILGLPKFKASIDFEETGEAYCCKVEADDKLIIKFEVHKLETKFEHLDIPILSFRNGQLLQTMWEVEGMIGTDNEHGGATFVLGDHQMATELGGLQLQETSIGRQFSSQAKAVLHKPTVLKTA
jgi:hypothetical protein